MMYNRYFSQTVLSGKLFPQKILSRKLLFLLLLFLALPLFSQQYAYMYIAGGTTSATLSNVWTTVGAGTDADFVSSVRSSEWSYASNVLTASSADAVEGYYSIKYSLSFSGAVTSWSVGISINGAAPVEPVFVRTISSVNKDLGNISGVMMVNITKGQTVRLQVKPNVASSVFTPVYAQVVLIKAKQSTVNYYGGMHISTDQLYAPIGQTFVKLTGFAAVSELQNWTFLNSQLTAGSGTTGMYYISFSASLTGYGAAGSPSDYTFQVVKGGVSGTTNIYVRRKADETDIGNVSAAGIVSISPGDIISIQARSQLPNKNLTIKKATLTLFKLADTNISKYAGEKITTNQTVDIVTQNTWTTVGTFTVDGLNGWTFGSNLMTPASGDAGGYYALEYTASVSTVNINPDNFEIGVFVGGTLHPQLSSMRRLSGSADTGCLCGVGLFNVSGVGSTVTLKVRNLTSTSDLVFKKSLLGLQQIHYVNYDPVLPITLNTFTATEISGNVKLTWQTASEIENSGFNIYRKDNNEPFKMISSYMDNDALRGHGTSTDMNDYDFIDTNVKPGNEYSYFVSDVSYQLEEVKHVDYQKTVYLSQGIKIGKVYPNPFNPSLTIPYTLDVSEYVKIDLVDITGKTIKTIINHEHNPGEYKAVINQPTLSSGVYFIKVSAGTQVEVQKIMMMK